MPDLIAALILIASGIGLANICFFVGAWVIYRGIALPGTGGGFLKDPKGDVFTVTDGLDEAVFPGSEEPSDQEQNILKKTNQFLHALSGGKDA